MKSQPQSLLSFPVAISCNSLGFSMQARGACFHPVQHQKILHPKSLAWRNPTYILPTLGSDIKENKNNVLLHLTLRVTAFLYPSFEHLN
jgi:hypothetical protein